MKNTLSLRLILSLVFALILSACLSESESQLPTPAISVTNLGNATMVETVDLYINLYGTAHSEEKITNVSWKNDRGGNGTAAGTDNWSIGRIRLQHGHNKITLTARDTVGNSNSKTVTINRDTRQFTAPVDSDLPVAMYSYTSDLQHAAPVANAAIDPGLVYIFLEPGKTWADRGIREIEYTCCDSVSRQSYTANVGPWVSAVEIEQSANGDPLELEISGSFSAGTSERESIRVDFLVAAADRSANGAPTISGDVPATGAVGINYVFLPTARDPDSDSMSFNIENMPSWARFDSTSGRLSGVPAMEDVGLHGDITISVSDGRTTTVLEPFSIRVDAFAPGTAAVSWVSPSERTDNSPLLELAGFVIHYGQVNGPLDNRVTIDNPSINSYIVDNLPSGHWRFMVTAFDSDGRVSAPSSEGQKRIP